MTEELLTALESCLLTLRQGQPLETVLERYPHLAAELRPLLTAAQKATRLGQVAGQPVAPASTTEAAHRAQFLAQATALRPTLRPAPKFPFNLLTFLPPTPREANMKSQPSFFVRAALIASVFIFGFVVGGYGMASASAASLPGDPLYVVKRALENTQYFFADAQTRSQLESDFATKRAQEVQTLAEQGRTETIEFTGRVERQEGELWVVAGVQVVVNAQTVLVGNPAVGNRVQVMGRVQADQTVLALRLRLEDEPPPAATTTNRPPEATRTPGATETEIHEATRTPRATEVEPTESPEPTEVEATETEEHEATNTPRPEPSRTPRPEPSRTPRPESSRTPEPTRTEAPPEPTQVEPTHTEAPPEPTQVEPSRTPEPTRTSEPTRTPESTRTPEPTRTTQPEPSRTPTLLPVLTETPRP